VGRQLVSVPEDCRTEDAVLLGRAKGWERGRRRSGADVGCYSWRGSSGCSRFLAPLVGAGKPSSRCLGSRLARVGGEPCQPRPRSGQRRLWLLGPDAPAKTKLLGSPPRPWKLRVALAGLLYETTRSSRWRLLAVLTRIYRRDSYLSATGGKIPWRGGGERLLPTCGSTLLPAGLLAKSGQRKRRRLFQLGVPGGGAEITAFRVPGCAAWEHRNRGKKIKNVSFACGVQDDDP